MSFRRGFQLEVLREWRDEICKKRQQIDPNGEMLLMSLWLGFAIGKGLTVDEARDCYNEALGYAKECEATGG